MEVLIFLRRRTRVPKSASFYFYPVGNFHEIDGFWSIVQKTGSDREERFRGKCSVPGPVSNGILMTAVGLPVWSGRRQVCHFVILCARTLRAPTGHSS